MKKQYTIQDILGLVIDCFGQKIESIFRGDKTLEPLEILEDEMIGMIERVWFGLQVLSQKNQRLFVSDCMDSVLLSYEEELLEEGIGLGEIRESLEVSRKYARGEASLEELRIASGSLNSIIASINLSEASETINYIISGVSCSLANYNYMIAVINAADFGDRKQLTKNLEILIKYVKKELKEL